MNIIIIDKDKKFCNELTNYLRSNGNITVENDFSNCSTAIKYLEKNNVLLELIILDLESCEVDISNIVDTSPDNCNIIAFFSKNKTCEKYINNPYLQRVFQKNIPFSSLLNYLNIQNNIENFETAKKNMLRILSDLGFNINHSGTTYLVETIVLAMRNKIKKLSDIYTLIAYNHSTDPKIIGWSVNNAINKTIKCDNANILHTFFKTSDNKTLTAKYIVNYLANYKNNT